MPFLGNLQVCTAAVGAGSQYFDVHSDARGGTVSKSLLSHMVSGKQILIEHLRSSLLRCYAFSGMIVRLRPKV